MAGHSHWSKIKRAKGANDAMRGKVWSKISRKIIIAAKNGGDPRDNLNLRYTIDEAAAIGGCEGLRVHGARRYRTTERDVGRGDNSSERPREDGEHNDRCARQPPDSRSSDLRDGSRFEVEAKPAYRYFEGSSSGR